MLKLKLFITLAKLEQTFALAQLVEELRSGLRGIYRYECIRSRRIFKYTLSIYVRSVGVGKEWLLKKKELLIFLKLLL